MGPKKFFTATVEGRWLELRANHDCAFRIGGSSDSGGSKVGNWTDYENFMLDTDQAEVIFIIARKGLGKKMEERAFLIALEWRDGKALIILDRDWNETHDLHCGTVRIGQDNYALNLPTQQAVFTSRPTEGCEVVSADLICQCLVGKITTRDLADQAKQLPSSAERITELVQQLRQLEETRETERQQARQDHQLQKDELERISQQQAATHQQLTAKDDEFKATKERNETLATELEALKQYCTESEAKIADLSARNEVVMNQCCTARAEQTMAENIAGELRAQLELQELENATLRRRLEKLQQTLECLITDKQQSEAATSTWRDAYQNLRCRVLQALNTGWIFRSRAVRDALEESSKA